MKYLYVNGKLWGSAHGDGSTMYSHWLRKWQIQQIEHTYFYSMKLRHYFNKRFAM